MANVVFRDFAVEDFPAWIETQHRGYIEERIQAGDDRATAERISAESYAGFFPDQRPAPGHDVFHVEIENRIVGMIWLGPHPRGLAGVWWVWDLEIDSAEQGHGYGRAAMLAAEEYVASRGGHALALNVFGFNAPARGLYESLGYETTSVQMHKSIPSTT
ncbi:GNAT family N-acetyltransferase [Agromyces italicus]|uniref:GNAT family N-acetyltransferase n=1 Tax=Agromyces italicus TaxID=279572 RepID=UPI0003B71D79|nr:GNAT family N-acetyltransferase [Agromyces italicus]